jgi:hypothetical protein
MASNDFSTKRRVAFDQMEVVGRAEGDVTPFFLLISFFLSYFLLPLHHQTFL